MTPTNSSASTEMNSQSTLTLYISDDIEPKEQSRKYSEIFSTAFVQLLMTGIYFVIYKAIETFLPEVVPESQIIVLALLLLLYVAYLAGVAFLYPKVMGNEQRIFSNEALAALFQIHLLFNAVYFLILWGTESNIVLGTFSFTALTLYVGFSVSLSNIFSVRTKGDFVKCFIQSYHNVGLTKPDFLAICIIDFCVVCVSLALQKYPYILLGIGVIVIIIHTAYSKTKGYCQKKFSAIVAAKLAGNGNFLIWKSGKRMSIYNSLKQALGITEAQIVADGLLEQMCLYDCIVVINDYPNNSDYLRYLTEIKQLLKADGVVIDPAVFKNHKGIVCSRTFAWLRIPNPSPIETSITQYENLLLNRGDK